MNIQWTYNDLRTKGPIIENVQSWETATIDLNRGTYRDTWPISPTWLFPTPNSVNGTTVPDDGQTTPANATSLTSSWPQETSTGGAAWTGTRAGKVRVIDEMMHVAPRTKTEGVVYWKFYSGAFVAATTPTSAITGVTSNNTTDILTKTAHGYKTGDIVKFVAGTNWDSLVVNTLYYVIKLGDDTFQLATTSANALIVNHVNLTGTNGTAGVFLGMTSADSPSGNLLGFVQLSEIVSWSVL